MVFSPCYSEYENELKSIGAEIFYEDLLEKNEYAVSLDSMIKKIKSQNIEMLIFANPNNPTGTILNRDEISAILETGIHLLVDETYVEFTDKSKFSAVELTNHYPNLFVARGVSKFLQLPEYVLAMELHQTKNY